MNSSSKPRALCAVLILIATQGCASIKDLTTSHAVFGSPETHGPHIYGGTRMDIEMIGADSHTLPPWFFTLIGILDLPFSIVLYTLLLPISIPMELLRSEPETTPEEPDP